ncbi:iron ABC transporter permease [Gordonia sp. w5E2]|uniref:Sugar ABC transporter substrate-binding protein n=1 Tax=Gordonia jacobaea TaxID=122202 RepID=A0ABR5IAT7_9ACTN|nr:MULTISPECIES: iron ABC transporter permease [Gordonia]KNA90729.1 sugar ABC transporter substrate-binding protein [Gordonia jacobaea]OBC14144.1 sugar ABC transporter substrate-binding protein [Gordonia sp. 852002-50816_SCH5313054-a]OBC18606.1 sugar ABC transporter substrate-binding protein [Gordonia sp. 852002-50816_SCH5313054-c]
MSTRSANPRATWTRPVSVAIGCGVALVVAAACGVAYGTVGIGWSVSLRMVWAAITGGSVSLVDAASYWIVVDSRVPRVLTGALVGAGLAVVGVIVQAMVRNPLADPYVLGISSGASVGATAVVLFGVFSGLGLYALPTAAFLGALLATLLVFGIAQRGGGLTPLRLVLTGTALGYGFSALTTVLIFLRPVGDAARSVMFWLLGSLAAATWHSVVLVAVVVVIGIGVVAARARQLNALAMGDEVAASLGIRASRFRLELFVIAALMTGFIVSVCGAIGFVGLIVPHVTRMVVGADHRKIILVAPVLGALFLVVADLMARIVVPPQEIPLGAITAAVGVPVFLGLMQRRRTRIDS